MSATRDKTGLSMFGLATDITDAPDRDGAPARQYDNAGDGLSKVTPNSPGWTADAPLREAGQRPSSKSATYPWNADTPVNAKNVKGTVQKPSTVQPID